jgi:hypothetical protein
MTHDGMSKLSLQLSDGAGFQVAQSMVFDAGARPSRGSARYREASRGVEQRREAVIDPAAAAWR